MTKPLAYSILEACAVARTGRTALYEAIRSGELAARKRGRRTLILEKDLRSWVEKLPVLAVPARKRQRMRTASRENWP
ncbi:MAG TPA: helix-turn-helix domain-containing protein [Xanthobacteraceae bacterium]|jgi:excisionase family DNA binding protein